MVSPSEFEPRRPRALITGKSGFTGRYVAQELERAGYEVFGLTRRVDGVDVDVNLLDRDGIAAALDEIAPVVVLHLAAISFVAHGDVDEIYRVNVVGTRNLLDALANTECRPRLVVLASSANIYGNATAEPVTESTPPAPMNDYAVSKLAMEYMAELWANSLPIVITRPFNYTGVGQSEQFLIPKIVAHFKQRRPEIELGNIDVFRDFSDVRDVARLYGELVANPPVGEVINICSGRAHSLAQIIGYASELAGYRIRVKVNPKFVRAGEVRRLVGSRAKVSENFGLPEPRPMIETLKWMLEA